jgi:hypothetical protein
LTVFASSGQVRELSKENKELKRQNRRAMLEAKEWQLKV